MMSFNYTANIVPCRTVHENATFSKKLNTLEHSYFITFTE